MVSETEEPFVLLETANELEEESMVDIRPQHVFKICEANGSVIAVPVSQHLPPHIEVLTQFQNS